MSIALIVTETKKTVSAFRIHHDRMMSAIIAIILVDRFLVLLCPVSVCLYISFFFFIRHDDGNFVCGKAANFNDALLLTRICMRQRTVRIILNYFCIHSFDIAHCSRCLSRDLYFCFFSISSSLSFALLHYLRLDFVAHLCSENALK